MGRPLSVFTLSEAEDAAELGQAANDGPGFGVASPHRAGLRSG